jgi:arylsulfatase A-like enzyme
MSAGQPPNIILITIDCWRGDHFGVKSGQPSPTPTLDTLSEECARFTKAFTCGGWTRPSMMAMFTSEYASHHHGGSLRGLSPALPVLSELLQQRGYTTAGFTANPVCGKNGNFDRGFDSFHDLKTDNRQSLRWNKLRKIRGFTRLSTQILSREFAHKLLHTVGLHIDLYELSASAKLLTQTVLSWLKESPPSPFFVWVHYIDLHWPYRLTRRPKTPAVLAQAWRDRQLYRNVVDSRGHFNPGPLAGTRWKEQYREELMTVDAYIDLLLNFLKTKGVWDETAVIVTSDHGEEFYEHGTWAHSWNQLYDEGVHIPLLIRIPEITTPQIFDHLVCTLDITPTLLDVAGVKKPETMKGISVLPLIRHDVQPSSLKLEDRVIAMEMFGHRNSHKFRLSVRNNSHSYLYDIETPLRNQCFELSGDTHQKHNIYHKGTPLSRQFDELRFNHMAPIIPQLLETKEGDTFEDLDREVAERLRELGYLS